MALPVSRIGDNCSGHSSFVPRPIVEGSGDVFVNGIPCARVGDALAPHGSSSPSPPHGGSISSGSATVFVNGQPMARISSAVDCGSVIVQGSGNVFVS
jgi:uncharacterized Zn-binding protein involved in type VI secretion